MTTNQTWQPIATAPRDGNPIIVIGFSDNARIPVTVFWSVAEDGWCFDDGENCYLRADYQYAAMKVYSPTHWMPLPQPPLDNQKE